MTATPLPTRVVQRPLFWVGLTLWIAVGLGLAMPSLWPPAPQPEPAPLPGVISAAPAEDAPSAPANERPATVAQADPAANDTQPVPTQVDESGNVLIDPSALFGGPTTDAATTDAATTSGATTGGPSGRVAPTLGFWDPKGVGEFSLTDSQGATVTRESLLGKPFAVSFIFTHCVGPCPRVTQRMRELQDRTRDTDTRLVTITVDPQRDTPEVLVKYARANGADLSRWMFLTGDELSIYKLIRDSFRMIVERNPNAPVGEEVVHTTSVLLVDAQGVVRAKYDTAFEQEMTALRRDLVALSKGEELELRPLTGSDAAALTLVPTEAATSGAAPSDGASSPALNAEAAAESPALLKLLPKINAGLNGLCTVLLAVGYVLIKSGRRDAHKWCMLSAFLVSILFLACYLTYHQMLDGYTNSHGQKFLGTGLARPIYFFILITHVVLAALVPFLAVATIYRGLRSQWTQHKSIARITFPIWMYVSVTGVVIYAMLYHWPAGL